MNRCLKVLLIVIGLLTMPVSVSAQGYGPAGAGCCNSNGLSWYKAGSVVDSGCSCSGDNVWACPKGTVYGDAFCNGSPYTGVTATATPAASYADGQLWYTNGVATHVFRTSCNCWEPIQQVRPTRVVVCISPKTVAAAPNRGECDGQVIVINGVGKYQWVASFDSWTILEQYQVPATATRRLPTPTKIQARATVSPVSPSPTLTKVLPTASPTQEPFSLIPKFLRGGSEEQPKETPTPQPTKTQKQTNTPKPSVTPKPTSTPKTPVPTNTAKPTNTPKPTETPKPTPTPGIEMLRPEKWPSPETERCISPVQAYSLPAKGQCNGQVVGLRMVGLGGTTYPDYQWNEKNGKWKELSSFEHPMPFDRPLTENEVHLGSILAILAVTGLGATGAAGTGFLAYKAIPVIVNTRKRRKEREEQYERARRCFEAGDFVSCEKLLRPLVESGLPEAKQLLNEAFWLEIYQEAKQYLAERDFEAAVRSIRRLQANGGTTEENGRMLIEALEGQKLHGICARAAKLFRDRRINQALEAIAQVPTGFRSHLFEADVLRAEITAYKAQEVEDFERLMAQAREAAGRHDWQAAMQAGQSAEQSHPDLFTSELAALVGSWEEIVANENACAQATVFADSQRWTEALDAMRHVPAGWQGTHNADEIRQRIERERRQDFDQLMSQAQAAAAQPNWPAAIENARLAQLRHPDLFTSDLGDNLRTWETALVNDTACAQALGLTEQRSWSDALQTLAIVPAAWHGAYDGDEIRQRIERERREDFGRLMAQACSLAAQFNWPAAIKSARTARLRHLDLFTPDLRDTLGTWETALVNDTACMRALELIDKQQWTEALQTLANVPAGWHQAYNGDEIRQRIERERRRLFGVVMARARTASIKFEWEEALRLAREARTQFPDLFGADQHRLIVILEENLRHEQACAEALKMIKAKKWAEAREIMRNVPAGWNGLHKANEIIQTLNRAITQLFGETMSAAYVAAQNGDYDKAIREAKKAQKKFPTLFDAECEAAVKSWWQAKSYDEACARAQIRIKAEKWDDASRELQAVPPDWPAAQALRSRIKVALDAQADAKRQEEAAAAYAEVIGNRTYFEILGVPQDADDATVKTAYRRLARQWHPDVNPGNAAAEGRFKAINEANEALETADKRGEYAQQLEQRRQDEQKAADLRARAAAFKNRRGHNV